MVQGLRGLATEDGDVHHFISFVLVGGGRSGCRVLVPGFRVEPEPPVSDESRAATECVLVGERVALRGHGSALPLYGLL